jgi:hypothetical protein
MQPTILTVSGFEKALAASAIGQYNTFRMFAEADDELAAQIMIYWNELHVASSGHVDKFKSVNVAWSAVFISWNVLKAGGSKSDFLFAARHSEFVHDAINHPRSFRGRRLDEHAPRVGDIIQNNREGNKFGFSHATANSQYPRLSWKRVKTTLESTSKRLAGTRATRYV